MSDDFTDGIAHLRVRTYLNNVLSLFQLEWDGSNSQVTTVRPFLRPVFNLTFRRGPKVKQEQSYRGDFNEENAEGQGPGIHLEC